MSDALKWSQYNAIVLSCRPTLILSPAFSDNLLLVRTTVKLTLTAVIII